MSGNIVPLNLKGAGNQNDFSSLFWFVFLNVWKQGRFGKVCSPQIHLSLTNLFYGDMDLTIYNFFFFFFNYLQLLDKLYTMYHGIKVTLWNKNNLSFSLPLNSKL